MYDKLPAQQSNPNHAPEHTKTDPTQAAGDLFPPVPTLVSLMTCFCSLTSDLSRISGPPADQPFSAVFFSLKEPFVRTSKAKRLVIATLLSSLSSRYLWSPKLASLWARTIVKSWSLARSDSLVQDQGAEDEYVEDGILPRPQMSLNSTLRPLHWGKFTVPFFASWP